MRSGDHSRYSLSIPCQRVRNQRPEDARRPGQLLAPGCPAPGLPGGSQAMAALESGWWSKCLSCSGRATLRLCLQPRNLPCPAVSRALGPRCPCGDARPWLSPNVCSSERFLCTCTQTPLRDPRLSPAARGVCGSPGSKAPEERGEAEESASSQGARMPQSGRHRGGGSLWSQSSLQ